MLRVDYDQIEVSANNLINQKVSFDECVSNMENIINALPDIWEADTCAKYIEQFEDNKQALRDVSDLIQDMSDQMKKISENFKNTDTDMAGQM